MEKWKKTKEIMRIETQWVSMCGENWIDEAGSELEYWRVERPDSVIILPVYKGSLLVLTHNFRPGVQEQTVDFPGGRLAHNSLPKDMVIPILSRELGVSEIQVNDISPVYKRGLNVDSSFSNQRLWGFVANIDDSIDLKISKVSVLSIPLNSTEINKLLSYLTCLQCRALLLEWLRNTKIEFDD